MLSAATGLVTGLELRSILVATDFSSASDKALRHALSIARHFGAKLFVMHAVSSLGLTMAGPEAMAQATNAALRDATLMERELVSNGALCDIRHQVIVRQGDVWAELKAVIWDKGIDLLVIGTRGRTGFKKLVLGSVAEQIFRNARCRVLTVGPSAPSDATLGAEGTPRPLLFVTDFSEASINALPHASAIAYQRGAKLVLFHAVPRMPKTKPNRWQRPDDMPSLRAAEAAAARSRLQTLSADLQGSVELECMTEIGDPAAGILRAARKIHAEIIVMGLKPRNFTDTLFHLPWSAAYDVVCEAVCPVLTVRSEDAMQ